MWASEAGKSVISESCDKDVRNQRSKWPYSWIPIITRMTPSVMTSSWPGIAEPHLSGSRNLADRGPRMTPRTTAGTFVFLVCQSILYSGCITRKNRQERRIRTGLAKIPHAFDLDSNQAIYDSESA